MSQVDNTIGVASEGMSLTLSESLQGVYGKLSPEDPIYYFAVTGYNPNTQERFEVMWGLTLVGIADKQKKSLN